MPAALDALAALPAPGARSPCSARWPSSVPDGRRASTARWPCCAEELGIRVVGVAAPAYGVAERSLDARRRRGPPRRLGAGDAVLVKGSRVAGLEAVAEALLGDRSGE